VTHADYALLVVDDSEDNRYTLTQRLKRQGYTDVTTAVDGREAMELLGTRRFDLVLLDIMMPEMNGYEVLERLKADEHLRHTPVIMISAVDQLESVVRCIELGAEDYLPKPFNPILLRARVGATLEKKRLRDEILAHRDRMERELQAAREIQLGMVPRELPKPTSGRAVEMFAALEPAREVGGDFYDVFYGEGGALFFVIADVSDKGAAAALFMARAKTVIRLTATLLGTAGQMPSPDVIVGRVNQELCRDNAHSMFVTLFLGILEPASGHLAFCNAGHNAPYLVSPVRGVRPLTGVRGKPAGIRATFPYESVRGVLAPDDCLFLFTDGITEAMDTDGAFFSEERLEGVLRAVAGEPPATVVSSVIGGVREFTGAASQSDDIAAMALRLPPTPSMRTVEATIRNRLGDLPKVTRIVDEMAASHRLSHNVAVDMNVALDEVLTNIITHGYADDGLHEITVRLTVHEDVFEAEVEDDGAPFDPLTIPPPDVRAPLQARPVGGLGIHFVRSLMSDVAYSLVGNRNRLRLRRRLSEATEASADGSA
jgi:phosphoserine phosphatase RsbU/P